MAGDIEEFLRRAAERRQQRANQRNVQQQPAARPAAPQYTDRAAERVPRAERMPPVSPVYSPPPQIEPLMAEVIEDDEYESMSDRRKNREAEDQSKIDVELHRHSQEGKQERGQEGQQATAVADLIRLLKTPNGMKQAILLREILEPRTNVWD